MVEYANEYKQYQHIILVFVEREKKKGRILFLLINI